jgi:hypothetical protein
MDGKLFLKGYVIFCPTLNISRPTCMNFGITKLYVQKLNNYEFVNIGKLKVNEICSVLATHSDEYEQNSLWKFYA